MTCSSIRDTRLPQKGLPELILQLRAAANVRDSYELQQELISHVRETEEARNAFSKAVKRMQAASRRSQTRRSRSLAGIPRV
jgi:hypothetical protein